MTSSETQPKEVRVSAGDLADILRTVRSIRDDLKLVPSKIIDEVVDHLKDMEFTNSSKARSGAHDFEVAAPASSPPDGADEVAGVLAAVDSVHEVDGELDSLDVQVKEKQSMLEELSLSSQIAKENFDNLQSQKTELENEVRELEIARKAAHEQVADLESQRSTLVEKAGEWQSVADQAEAIRLLEDKERGTREECSELQKQNAVAQALLDKLWPEWIKARDMAEWKTNIELGIANRASSPAVGLLFAALHTFSAALHDDDPKTLHDSLRDVGRRFYAWLRESGKMDDEAAVIADKWAQAINGECEGRGEVEVPVPGHAANNQWMIFQPRGGSSPDVLSVRSWCVRDAQRRPVHRAEVTV
jgi:hypothetical protein